MMNTVFTVQYPSIKSCDTKLKLVSDKLAGVSLKSNGISKNLDKALKKAEMLRTKVGKKSAKNLAKLEAKINRMIKNIHANEKRTKAARVRYKKAAPIVQGLVDKRPKYLGKIETVLGVLNYVGVDGWEAVLSTSVELAADATVDALLD